MLDCVLAVFGSFWISGIQFWENGAGRTWRCGRINIFEHTTTLSVILFLEGLCLRYLKQSKEKHVSITCSLLLSWGSFWGVHRGGWPEGRGSARTLVAGGLPLSDGETFRNLDLQTHCFNLFLRLKFSSFQFIPINLTRHFSRPRLCWCCGCQADRVRDG